MHRAIEKILKDEHPECSVKGHRVHTTISSTNEDWPEWGCFVYGIGGGFVHFECEEDGVAWNRTQQAA